MRKFAEICGKLRKDSLNTFCTHMAKIYATLDTRRPAPNGECYIRIYVNHNNSSSLHTFGYTVSPDNWDNKKKCVIGKQADAINRRLEATLYEWRLAMFEVLRPSMTAKQLKEAILNYINPQETAQSTFVSAYRQFMQTKEGRTLIIYKETLHRLQQFDSDIDTRMLEDIIPKFLERFDKYLARTAPSPNARAIHFRNIRAVFNFAIDEELTTYYPFRKFKIKHIETAKRSLSVEELRKLWAYTPEPYAVKYLDIFKLIFLLIGINIVDLSRITTINNGRIEYNRAKTRKLYSIKVEPEAMELLGKFADERGHLDFLGNIKSYKTLAQKVNQALQKLGNMERKGLGGKKYYTPLFPSLTTYWARHTWATIASELDIPNETIAAALGHSYGNRTTAIYIRFNQKKVDEANRRVIDYVLYDRK